MGKRKERLVAKMGAGRRVKLDLFAEPSGDVGGSPAKDDDGKDEDNKLDQELPNSPSSSSQPRENPLSLLGQYSDDELDYASKEEATNSNDNKQSTALETFLDYLFDNDYVCDACELKGDGASKACCLIHPKV